MTSQARSIRMIQRLSSCFNPNGSRLPMSFPINIEASLLHRLATNTKKFECIGRDYCRSFPSTKSSFVVFTAYYNDIVVGGVCCRIDTSENLRRLYIMTLGCLYPYRRLGIGTKMVEHVLNYVYKDGHFDSIFL